MAERVNEIGKIPYNSPGVYFRTIDLTTITDQIGEFRGAQIGLMERGPAFEVMDSKNFTRRSYTFGDLNPNYPTSYFARQYLEQAEGLKEVRVLGLEGYYDTVGYAVMSGNVTISPKDNPGTGTYDSIIEANGANNKLLALLKQRKTDFTGLPAIYSVELEPSVEYGNSDLMFKLVIIFDQAASKPDMEILCSLREDSKDYIVRVLGNHPLQSNKIGADIAPLWVDFIDPTAPELRYDYYQKRFKSRSYYNGVIPSSEVDLITGNIEINTAAPVSNYDIENVVITNSEVRVFVSGNATNNLTVNNGISFSGLKGVTNDYIELLNNQQFLIGSNNFDAITNQTSIALVDPATLLPLTNSYFGVGVDFAIPATILNTVNSNEFKILDASDDGTGVVIKVSGNVSSNFNADDVIEIHNLLGLNVASLNNTNNNEVLSVSYNAALTLTEIKIKDSNGNPVIIPNLDVVYNNPTLDVFILPTWQKEVLDFEGQQYLTPSTPWFVSQVDNSGNFKRLFKLWSISDGESANTEIKVDITDINPYANGGNGFFNLTIRTYNNRDDSERNRLETYNNLTFDKNSDNYILRRIGDGEEFPLRSQFVFVELNVDEELENDLLPFGILGYPNLTGNKMEDIPWTVDYDKTKAITSQTLGVANNSINMKRKLAADLLSFKPTSVIGKGFYLNPIARNTGRALTLDAQGNVTSQDFNPTELNNTFVFAAPTIYSDINGKLVSQTEQVRRNKFTVAFYGGFDGWNVYKEREWGNPNSKDFEALTMATNLFQDSELLDTDFTIMVSPDINIRDHSDACSLISNMILRRDDAVYLPDFAYDVNADSLEVTNILDSSNFKSNHISMYHPWLQISDNLNKVNPWVPASLLAWGTIANLGNQGQVWNPPGGVIKTVTNNLVRARKRLDLSQREILFSSNINPISKFGAGAYEIVGVRTTQPYLSALSFVHNKLLLCYAKKALRQTLRALLFTMNNEEATDQFIIRVTPIFERIKRLNGLSEFKVSTRNELALNDKTTLYGVVEIVPLYPIERIIVDFVLKDGDLQFEN